MLLLAACLLSTGGTPLPHIVPIPEPRPEVAAPSVEEPSERNTPEEDPVDSSTEEPADSAQSKDDQDSKPDSNAPPPIEVEDPKAYAACIAELKSMGVAFAEIERIDDGNGCGIDRPIEVRSLGNKIALDPPGTVRCQTAINLARWTREVVVPMLEKAQPMETLATVNQSSAYVCRKRNGASTGKISEHAHGNAVDIAGFIFKSGKTFTIAPRQEDPTLNGAFQRAIASAACLYFSTVLDPGSDKAHEAHLHLDTLKRKGGYRYCW
jgi:hypothetical protein